MTLKSYAISAVLVLATAAPYSPSFAFQDEWGRTHVTHQGDDDVGRRLAYNVREMVNQSSLLQLESSKPDAFLRVIIHSIRIVDSSSQEYASAYTVIYLMPPMNESPLNGYWTSGIGTCGRDVVAGCAETIVAEISAIVESFRSGN